MPKRKSYPTEGILNKWAEMMTNSASKVSSSSESDRGRAASSTSSVSNESPCVPSSRKKASRRVDVNTEISIRSDAEEKIASTGFATPKQGANDTMPSFKSPFQAPVTSKRDSHQETAAVQGRESSITQNLGAAIDLTDSSVESDVIDLTEETKGNSEGNSGSASASEDDPSVIEIVDDNPISSGNPIRKKINKRKAPAFRRDFYARKDQPSSSSIRSVDDDSGVASEHSEDSSVQLLRESPVQRETQASRVPKCIFARRDALSTGESDDEFDSTEDWGDSAVEVSRNGDIVDPFTRRQSLPPSESVADSDSTEVSEDFSVVFVEGPVNNGNNRNDDRADKDNINHPVEPLTRRDSLSTIHIDDDSDSTEASEDSSSEVSVEGPSNGDNEMDDRSGPHPANQQVERHVQQDSADSPVPNTERPSCRLGATAHRSPDFDLPVVLAKLPNIGERPFLCTPSASNSAPSSSDGGSSKKSSDSTVARDTKKNAVASVPKAEPEKRKKKVKRSVGSCLLLARQPTENLKANGRTKQPPFIPRLCEINHDNPAVFFPNNAGPSSKTPLLASAHKRPSIKAIRALARGSECNIEIKGTELTKHRDQTYNFVDTSRSINLPQRSIISRRVQCPRTQFEHMFEQAMVNQFKMKTEEIEDEELVRAANKRISRELSHDQTSAQYGRMLPGATETVFRLLGLTREDLYLDIGAGLYNSVLQAAFTIGCESRGIEIVEERHQIGLQLKRNLKEQLSAIIASNGGRIWKKVGKVSLLRGRLEDPNNFDFLANCSGTKLVKAFANNFNGVFADRSAASNQIYYLDHYIAGLFAEMKPGSVLVTLHKLDLPLSFTEATELRKRHSLKCDADVSFYDMTQTVIGKANECVSWSVGGGNKHDIIVYRYERLQQKSERAVFRCCNPECKIAKGGPIPATKKYLYTSTSGTEERTVVNHRCSCDWNTMSLRHRGSKESDSK